MIKTNMSACVEICFRLTVTSSAINTDFAPTSLQFCASILCQDIFNYYLLSYMMKTVILACRLTCLDIYGDLEGKKLVKNKSKLSILNTPEFRIFNMMPWYCAKTSSMTIYGDILWRLICQHVFWPVSWENKPKKADFALKWLKFNQAHLYCVETSLEGYYLQKWWRMVYQYVSRSV